MTDILVKCDKCNGTGRMGKYNPDRFLMERCDKCNGQGKLYKSKLLLKKELDCLKTNKLFLGRVLRRTEELPEKYKKNMFCKCDKCYGVGEIYTKHLTLKVDNYNVRICGKCKGKGEIKIKTLKEIDSEVLRDYIDFKNQENKIKDYIKRYKELTTDKLINKIDIIE